MILVADIQRRVCEHYGISMSDMLSPCRARPIARPRQVAMYLAARLTGKARYEIARRFNRDHSTLYHGVDFIARERVNDRRMDVTVRAFLLELQQ